MTSLRSDIGAVTQGIGGMFRRDHKRGAFLTHPHGRAGPLGIQGAGPPLTLFATQYPRVER